MFQFKLTTDLEKKHGVPSEVIKKHKKLGWEFYMTSWTDRHKGDDYYELQFKSPNMKDFSSVASTYFGELSDSYLLMREAFAVAHDWSDGVFNDKSVIQNPISKKLAEVMVKRKDCKFKNLWASGAEFKVNISPKVGNVPKKIKVLITIE